MSRECRECRECRNAGNAGNAGTSPFLSFWRHFSGPYGHQSGTMSLVPGVVYGAGFCHSKAWWRLFILAPPRVPDLASGRTLTALAAPSASSKVFSRNFSQRLPFSPWGPSTPPACGENQVARCNRAFSHEEVRRALQDYMGPEL